MIVCHKDSLLEVPIVNVLSLMESSIDIVPIYDIFYIVIDSPVYHTANISHTLNDGFPEYFPDGSESVFDIAKTPELYATWQGVFDTLYTVTLNVASLNGAYYIGATSVGNNLEITGIVLS